MMLRIIAGKFRSRKLIQPPLSITRSTKDRVREAVFSAIGSKVVNATVLDLFAGSGAYGLEAASRGAGFIYLNDQHQVAIKVIQANILSLKVEQTKVSQMDALEFIRMAIDNHFKFDIAFFDPPYAYAHFQDLLSQFAKGNLLNAGGIIVYENESEVHNLNEDKFVVKSYNYGRTVVHIGWKKE